MEWFIADWSSLREGWTTCTTPGPGTSGTSGTDGTPTLPRPHQPLLSLFEHQQGPGITDVSLYRPLIGQYRPLIGHTLTLDAHITDSDQLGLESIGAEHNISFSHNISIFPCRNCQEIALNLTKQRYISIRAEYHLTPK